MPKSNAKMSLKGFIFSFLWIASLLTIGSVFSFSMFDEVLCVFVLLCALQQGFWKSPYLIILTTYVFIHIAISIMYGYNGIKPILLDSMMYVKPYVCAFACGSGYFVLKKKDINGLNVVIYCLLCFFFIDSIAAWFVGARISSDRPPFWFTTNVSLAATTTLMLLFCFLMQMKDGQKITTLKNSFLYIVLLMPPLITNQGKYFGFVFSFFVLMFFSEKMLVSMQSGNLKIRSFYKMVSVIGVVLGILGVLHITRDDIKAYYITDNENIARAMMLRSLPQVLDGIYFFTGRGFGAFCSPVTRIYYPTTFMDEIGLSHIYGLSISYSNFMADGYLWSYAGCFGVMGIFLYIAFMIYMFDPFVKLLKNKILPPKLGFACLVCFSWIIIFSFGSGLTFGYGTFLMIIWGMLRWKAVLILEKENKKENYLHV